MTEDEIDKLPGVKDFKRLFPQGKVTMSDDSMVERVARAMNDCLGRHPSAGFGAHEMTDLARAAIAAMREPTAAMLKAGLSADLAIDLKYDDSDLVATRAERVDAIWQAAIDSALAAPEKDNG